MAMAPATATARRMGWKVSPKATSERFSENRNSTGYAASSSGWNGMGLSRDSAGVGRGGRRADGGAARGSADVAPVSAAPGVVTAR